MFKVVLLVQMHSIPINSVDQMLVIFHLIYLLLIIYHLIRQLLVIIDVTNLLGYVLRNHKSDCNHCFFRTSQQKINRWTWNHYKRKNKQLKLKFEESNTQVEKLNVLVSKQMKDMAQLGDHLKKLKNEIEELKEQLLIQLSSFCLKLWYTLWENKNVRRKVRN